MSSDHAMTCYIELPGGRRVEVGITVIEEPLFPTPNKPEIQRVPGIHEWADICGALATMRMTMVKTEESRPPEGGTTNEDA